MKRIAAVMGVVVLGVVWTCGCAPDERVVPDAFVAPETLPDAWFVPVDTGPPVTPVCTGTAQPCRGRDRDQCVAGCAPVSCTGTPDDCERNFSADTCALTRGCHWGGDQCLGFPEDCEAQLDATQCTLQGCSWSSPPACEGSPTPCTSLSSAQCLAQPGCRSNLDAGPPDAGSDAGFDAGPPDAGPACRPMGDCDPFSPSSCGGGLQCIVDSMGTRCVAPAFTLRAEGASCAVDNECMAGLTCLGGPAGLRCTRMCRTGQPADCTGAGTVCGRTPRAAETCLRLCDRACDLYDQDCPVGQACVSFAPVPGERVAACFLEGSVAVGGACTYADACVRGAACVSRVCSELCRTSADCTTGTCHATATPGIDVCG